MEKFGLKASRVLGGETNKHYLHEGILDLHKPYVDDIILVSDSGKPMKRVADLIDVWYSKRLRATTRSSRKS